MMKKILTLVLVMAVSVMAGPVDIDVTSPDATTVEIAYTGSVVGMALDITCTDTLVVTAIDMPAFFDVFMDYAYVQGESYVYGSGDPVADKAAAGVATLPSASFCISAGGLEDDGTDTVPASGVITLTVSGEGTLTVGENTLRGGLVDYDGAMTVTYTSDNVVIASGDTPEQIQWDTMNINADGFVNSQDVATIVGFINTNGAAPFYSIPSTDASYDATYDLNSDGFINSQDVATLVGYINTNGTAPFYSIARP